VNGNRSLGNCLKNRNNFNFVIFLQGMNKKLKYGLIIAFIIIVILVIYNYSSSTKTDEEALKQQEIDNTFNIWLDIAGSGDKQTLLQNATSIKQDLSTKLTTPEITSLKQYSTSIKDLLSVKDKPLNPLFLASLSYLTSNFQTAKQIISKTSVGNMLSGLVLGPVPQSNYNPITI
jgi:hypothetical protein